MTSLNSIKFIIFLAILHRSHQFNIAESFFYHYTIFPISNETFLTECHMKFGDPIPIHKIHTIHSDPIDSIEVDHLLFRCTKNSTIDITQGIRANTTNLYCNNEVIKLEDVNVVRFENCNFSSFPHQLLQHFKHINFLDMTGLSLEVLRNDDIPLLIPGPLGMPNLDLSNNNLTRIENGVFPNQDTIEVISFNKNRLRYLNGKMFGGLFGLQSLNLAENDILEISARTFYELPKLRRVNLNGNRIESVGDFWFNTINKLRKLDLSNNHIMQLNRSNFARLHHLKELNLSGNRISRIVDEAFEWLVELEKLFLRDNRIRRVDGAWFGRPNQLTHLILSYNSITELNSSNFVNFNELKYLDLENNGLVDIPKHVFSELKRLEELDLDHNQIQSICFSWFSANNSLWKLNLSFNKLFTLERGFFVRLANLTNLDVSNSMVEHIEDDIFVPLERLNTIDLSYNRLRRVNVTAAFGLTHRSMRYLYLDSNLLQEHLDTNKIEELLPDMMDISIENNQFDCEYLHELDDEMEKRKRSIRYHTDYERSCSKYLM